MNLQEMMFLSEREMYISLINYLRSSWTVARNECEYISLLLFKVFMDCCQRCDC
jgi:hypothetical protein